MYHHHFEHLTWCRSQDCCHWTWSCHIRVHCHLAYTYHATRGNNFEAASIDCHWEHAWSLLCLDIVAEGERGGCMCLLSRYKLCSGITCNLFLVPNHTLMRLKLRDFLRAYHSCWHVAPVRKICIQMFQLLIGILLSLKLKLPITTPLSFQRDCSAKKRLLRPVSS